uniref:ATP-dependent Clp protease proteolytic subunit n=1 Tax=Clausia trichosepala TaxID=264422 RepID=A0A6M9QJV6_9BRAS|nr:ATP-dependent protease subunit [Clausia trichosepala]
MPVGIPKVPYLIPGDDEDSDSWIDLYNRLYRERLFYLGEEINTENSNNISGLMVYFSIEDETQEQYLFINSPGGWVVPGLAIHDTIKFVQVDVSTICIGLAASIASVILLGGTVTKRSAYSHARVMIHQPKSSFLEAQSKESIFESTQILRIRDMITGIYIQKTGKPYWRIIKDLERDSFMSPQEAKEHGIIDFIASEHPIIAPEEEITEEEIIATEEEIIVPDYSDWL